MAVNKVEANGETLIDLTNDTVTADTLVEGRTAHLASGEQVTGTFKPVTGVKGNSETSYRTGNVNLTPANIGAVNKSGDTMTGTLTHQASSIFFKATNLDLNGGNPSTYTYGNSRVEFVDKDGQRSGFINAGRQIAGATQFSLAASARNTADTIDVYNQFDISVARDGTCSYKVTDPTAFRKAIGLGTDWTFAEDGIYKSNIKVATFESLIRARSNMCFHNLRKAVNSSAPDTKYVHFEFFFETPADIIPSTYGCVSISGYHPLLSVDTTGARVRSDTPQSNAGSIGTNQSLSDMDTTVSLVGFIVVDGKYIYSEPLYVRHQDLPDS